MNGKHIPQYLNIMSLFEVVPSVAKGFRLWQNDLKKKKKLLGTQFKALLGHIIG